MSDTAGKNWSAVDNATQPSRQNSTRKFRGLTCANCRTRKVRCNGGQPGCKTCEVYGVECRYDKAPSISQVLHLSKQLRQAEDTIAELRQRATAESRSPAASTSASISATTPTATAATEGPSNPNTLPAQGPALVTRHHHSPGTSELVTHRDVPQNLSLDEQGKIAYYGPTSAVHEPVEHASPVSNTHTQSGGSTWDASPANLALAAPADSSMWEDFALENAARKTGIPREVLDKLLYLHWTWVAPMFMWVYKPAFLRDMLTGGRYFSELLLTVLCAHSAKYLGEQYTQLLDTRLRSLLSEAIYQPSSIPTVQALLQLSAREMANGTLSQAWLYSGMAFRMSEDLVLQHHALDMTSVQGVNQVDLEVRQRLAWSCYFWDKAISLYTGRAPSMTEVPSLAALDSMLDDPADNDVWSPFHHHQGGGGGSVTLTTMAPYRFPSMKGHVVSCFANSCKLAVILSDIIQQLYTRQHSNNTSSSRNNLDRTQNNHTYSNSINTTKPHAIEASVNSIQDRLDEWRAQSPPHIKYDPAHLPEVCPPPHVLCQNVLFYTAVILAHRPFLNYSRVVPAWRHHYTRCVAAAADIERLLLLYERAYGFNNISYLMGYCAYTGASVWAEYSSTSVTLASAPPPPPPSASAPSAPPTTTEPIRRGSRVGETRRDKVSGDKQTGDSQHGQGDEGENLRHARRNGDNNKHDGGEGDVGGKARASSTMRTFLRALQNGSKKCPVLGRSLAIIVKSLQPGGIQGGSGGGGGGGVRQPHHHRHHHTYHHQHAVATEAGSGVGGYNNNQSSAAVAPPVFSLASSSSPTAGVMNLGGGGGGGGTASSPMGTAAATDTGTGTGGFMPQAMTYNIPAFPQMMDYQLHLPMTPAGPGAELGHHHHHHHHPSLGGYGGADVMSGGGGGGGGGFGGSMSFLDSYPELHFGLEEFGGGGDGGGGGPT